MMRYVVLFAVGLYCGSAAAISVTDTTSHTSWNPSQSVPRRFSITVNLAPDEVLRRSDGGALAEVRFARHRVLGPAGSGVGHVGAMTLVSGTTNQFTYTASATQASRLERADALHYEFKVYYGKRVYPTLTTGREYPTRSTSRYVPTWSNHIYTSPQRRLVAGCPGDQENMAMRADKNDIVARFPRSMPWLTLPLEYQSRPFGFAQVKNGGVAFARLGSVYDTLFHDPNREMPDSVVGRPDVLIYRNRSRRWGESTSAYHAMVVSDTITERDGFTFKTMTLDGYGYGKVFWPTRRPKIRIGSSTGPIACYASDRQAVHEAEYHIKYLGWMRGMNTPPVPMDNPRGSAIATQTNYWRDKFICANWESGNTLPPCKRVRDIGPWGIVIPGIDAAFWHPRFWTMHVWLPPGNTTASIPVPTINPPVPMTGVDLAVDGFEPFYHPATWH